MDLDHLTCYLQLLNVTKESSTNSQWHIAGGVQVISEHVFSTIVLPDLHIKACYSSSYLHIHTNS